MEAVGFDSAAQRKREFAADMALQSHALRMAAVSAYEQVVGEAWKPFERATENPGKTVDRKAAVQGVQTVSPVASTRSSRQHSL
ncbi:hypothetical protein MesoLj131a_66100 (plasmid) [Mesorhizobium sp. 131-2-1]|nr:hypothetical protein MesoLj131a_66100 [Mesorhizobium sp. 131-2-1]